MLNPCPICGTATGDPLFERDRVPVALNRPYPSAAAARDAPLGRFAFAFCRDCEFGFNAAFDPSLTLYDDGYENEQAHSAVFREHLDRVADRVVAACGARSGPIVEIGCGQGGFLRRLGTRLGEGAVLVGVDAVCRAVADARTDIRYFASLLGELDERDVPRAAAVVYARHVIEHVPDPVGFLAEWASTGIAPAGTPILLETPRLEWILETGTLVDFVYEHCNYFSARSLARIVARAGFALQSIAPFFNGQYALVEARKADGPVAASVAHSHIAADAMRFASAERRLEATWHARIRAAAEAGPVAVWGAGAKGVTLVNLFDPDAALVDCLIDVNPAKQGRFVPGTGHAIVTPEAASGRGIVAAFVMNDNYLVEMRAQIGAFAQPFALLSFDDGA